MSPFLVFITLVGVAASNPLGNILGGGLGGLTGAIGPLANVAVIANVASNNNKNSIAAPANGLANIGVIGNILSNDNDNSIGSIPSGQCGGGGECGKKCDQSGSQPDLGGSKGGIGNLANIGAIVNALSNNNKNSITAPANGLVNVGAIANILSNNNINNIGGAQGGKSGEQGGSKGDQGGQKCIQCNKPGCPNQCNKKC